MIWRGLRLLPRAKNSRSGEGACSVALLPSGSATGGACLLSLHLAVRRRSCLCCQAVADVRCGGQIVWIRAKGSVSTSALGGLDAHSFKKVLTIGAFFDGWQ